MKKTKTLSGRAYIRPVGRGVRYDGCNEDLYIDDIIEEMVGGVSGSGRYINLTITIEIDDVDEQSLSSNV